MEDTINCKEVKIPRKTCTFSLFQIHAKDTSSVQALEPTTVRIVIATPSRPENSDDVRTLCE